MKHWLIGLLLLLFVLPTSAQTDAPIIGPTSYPPGVNPLTGLPTDPDLLNRRPLIVKISNYPALVRSQQRGLNEADLVWEHLLSGGVTRFSAVFLSSDHPRVGPIRSARLVDFEFTRLYRALFSYSGMAQGTIDVLRGDRLMLSRVVGGGGPCPPLCYYPQAGVAQEHTMYADTAGLRALAQERGQDTTPEPLTGMAFSDAPHPAAVPMASATVRYREMVVEWTYDPASGRWNRATDGEPHFDAEGVRISAANVVIVEEIHTIQPDVFPGYWGPGDFAFSVNFIGTGRVFFLRDGTMVEGRWIRANRADSLTFVDDMLNPLPFKPGNTFFNLVPRWIDGYELAFVPPEPPMVSVNGSSGVAMRYGPNDLYVSPDVAYPDDAFAALGRNHNGTWLQVQRDNERPVWLPLNRLRIGDLDVMALPNPRPSNERG